MAGTEANSSLIIIAVAVAISASLCAVQIKEVVYENDCGGSNSMARVIPTENTELEGIEMNCFDPCKLAGVSFFLGSACEEAFTTAMNPNM